jgi:hypothetical protein
MVLKTHNAQKIKRSKLKMSKKIDERLPQDFALKFWPGYAAIKSPWDKLMNFKEMSHFVVRADSVLGASVMQAFRIVLPDYDKRATLMAETFESVFQNWFVGAKTPEGGDMLADDVNGHPFCTGSYFAALEADFGDERNLMCGRVNDFGSYRVEKELDVCYWDVIGSELCRSTVYGLEGGMGNVAAELHLPGPQLEFNMVEAKGCGDLHCRVVAECRKKYPMPPKEKMDHFGPIATDDLIKFTPEEECLKESQMFREECNYTYANGANKEMDASIAVITLTIPVACMNLLPCIYAGIAQGMFTKEDFDHALRCVCEAAGKAAFGDFFAKEGLRTWLGVPREIDEDGRLLGGYIEMYLQGRTVGYEIEAFNEDEVIYVIDRASLASNFEDYVTALVTYWYGMSKTLINAQWSAWEEDSPEGKLRLKIAKKIDKFC